MMFLDLNLVEPKHFQGKTFDVCVCGAGVAGITLALELSQALSVALLEGGGRAYSEASQSLYDGRNIGADYFDLKSTRVRFFGGTSNHWQGWSRPLNSHDFQKRAYVEHSGWPISHADLEPYSDAAKRVLEISDHKILGVDPAKVPLPRRIDGFRDTTFWVSPLRFGTRYAGDVERSGRISCYLHANVTDLRLDGNRIAYVTAADYAGRSFQIAARTFVLALGGIENARLLLNCNRQRPAGLGNQHDLVGRFFAEHPHFRVGAFLLEDGVQISRMRIFEPSPALLEAEQILNFGLRCTPKPQRARAGFKAKLRRAVCSTSWLKSGAQYLRGAIDCSDGSVRITSEQSPNAGSRITLSEDTDRLGLRKAVLDWRLSQIDLRTMLRAVMRFGEALAEARLGRVQVAEWLLASSKLPGVTQDEVGGHHHMCTTRMAACPRQGVVDVQQRLFEANNLYVAGSSVFSSGGYANPTFTIVQMSLRLADHLKRAHRTPALRTRTAAVHPAPLNAAAT
jgi:choline dehydrogenase-like flavoprotein